jgi:hypothetical protein
MVNINKLKGRIVEKFGSCRKFAEVAGICYVGFCAKMTGKRNVTYSDVVEWSRILEIDQRDIGDYFFCKEC